MFVASSRIDALQDAAWDRGGGRNICRHRCPGAAAAHGVCTVSEHTGGDRAGASSCSGARACHACMWAEQACQLCSLSNGHSDHLPHLCRLPATRSAPPGSAPSLNPTPFKIAGAARGQPECAVAAAGAVQPNCIGGGDQRDGCALAVGCAGTRARVAPAAAQDPGEGKALTGAPNSARSTKSILQGCVSLLMAPLILGSPSKRTPKTSDKA